MATSKRNIGKEILDGLREIKKGEYGRVTTIPSVASIREKTGLSQFRFAQLVGGIAAYATRVGTRSACTFRCGPNIAPYRREKSACIARSCVGVCCVEIGAYSPR